MTYSLSNNCTKNYYNRTLTVQVIVEDVVTWIFLKHSVYAAIIFFKRFHYVFVIIPSLFYLFLLKKWSMLTIHFILVLYYFVLWHVLGR